MISIIPPVFLKPMLGDISCIRVFCKVLLVLVSVFNKSKSVPHLIDQPAIAATIRTGNSRIPVKPDQNAMRAFFWLFGSAYVWLLLTR